MVVEKGLPRSSWGPADCSDDSGDGPFGDGDAEHLQFAMNPRCAPERIGSRHPLDQPANLDGGGGPPRTTAMESRQPRPESAKSFALPARDSVGLEIDERAAPTGPPLAESDPEYAIEGRQQRSFPLSLEGCELEAECGVLESEGLVAAHQQPNESKDAQQKGWHEFRFFRSVPIRVNWLRPDRIMANDRSDNILADNRFARILGHHQAASRTSTVICLPRTASAAWIFSAFVACSGSSMRRITRSWSPRRRARSELLTF